VFRSGSTGVASSKLLVQATHGSKVGSSPGWGVRWRHLGRSHEEEKAQEINGGRYAQLTIIINVGRVKASRGLAPQEQITKRGHGIAQFDRPVAVGVPTDEDRHVADDVEKPGEISVGGFGAGVDRSPLDGYHVFSALSSGGPCAVLEADLGSRSDGGRRLHAKVKSQDLIVPLRGKGDLRKAGGVDDGSHQEPLINPAIPGVWLSLLYG